MPNWVTDFINTTKRETLMSSSFKENSRKKKLLQIFDCIEKSCNSSVRIFDRTKGHSNRSVGITAYEERQQRLKDIAENYPNVIEFLCRKGGHNYFKFEGRTIKIISSPRETLNKNVFEKNMFERGEEFEKLDPLLRIIYRADYDLVANEAKILECHFLEINRNTGSVTQDINILDLIKNREGYISEVITDTPDSVELPMSGLLKKSTSTTADSID